MRFSPEFIERLRSHFLISEVVGKRVPLKRHGREWSACCPFHKEKSPSFTVNDDKGFYHCFGCGAHGDAIGFVKEYENLSYVETIERLANEAGMALPQVTPQEQARFAAAKNLYDAMDAAAQWFAMQLETPAAMPIRDYLAGRGIDREAIAQFRIGFAPADRNGLRTHLLAKGFTENQMLEAGLLIPSDRGLPFSRFTERLMFPIGDRQGRIIAFGGRILPNATATTGMASAKYVNSPDTPLFHKGQVLYNFSTARRAAKDANRIVVSEGYMDVIALAQAGIQHAVAPLGTALTEEHLRQLWQTVPEPILCLDGDAAGQRAMWRSAELALPLLQAGQGLRFALLPDGHDPDSLLRARGPEAVHGFLNAAIPLSEALWNHGLQQHPEASPESRARLEKMLMGGVEKIQDANVKRHFRQYMIDQLRGLSRKQSNTSAPSYAAPSRNSQNGKFGKAPVISSDLHPGARALGGHSSATLAAQGFCKSLLCLVALSPQLLESDVIEEDLHRIPDFTAISGSWLPNLLKLLHSDDGAGVGGALGRLSPADKAALEENKAQARLHIHHRLQVAAEGRDMTTLRHGWRMYMAEWEEYQLNQERNQLEKQPVEESFPQLLELQRHLQQLQKERLHIQEYLDQP